MTEPTERVVQLNRGVEQAAGEARARGPQHQALEVWVGRWINNGHTINEDGTPGLTITTSDVYEWAPGGFFILHTAFGRAGEHSGGAVEIIGYDDATGTYTSHLYDSQGNVVVSSLVSNGGTWTYQGDTTRSTVEFSDDGRVQTVLHERTDDGVAYTPSMSVTLVKVD